MAYTSDESRPVGYVQNIHVSADRFLRNEGKSVARSVPLLVHPQSTGVSVSSYELESSPKFAAARIGAGRCDP